MSRYAIIIRSTVDRERAHKVLAQAPFGSRFEIKAAKRTIPQSDKMWAMLTEVAQQLPWHGKKRTPDVWKILFLDSLHRAETLLPGIDGELVNISRSSSDLTKSEMAALIDMVYSFGIEHGVNFAAQEAA